MYLKVLDFSVTRKLLAYVMYICTYLFCIQQKYFFFIGEEGY